VGIVRLVAGVAEYTAGMLDRDYLREASGLGSVLFVTAAAEVGHVGEHRFVRRGVIGMVGLRAVAGFAGDMGMFAGRARFALVFMTHEAHVLAGENEGFRPDQVQSLRPVMAIFSESFRHHGGADGQKQAEAEKKNYCWTYQMARVPEQANLLVVGGPGAR